MSHKFAIDRRTFLALTAPAAALCAVNPLAALAADKTIKMAYVPSTLFAPVFIALDRGYFTAEGLAVDAAPAMAGQDVIALLSTGRLDFISAGVSAAFFNAVNRGLDVKFAASTSAAPKTNSPNILMVRQDLWASGAVKQVPDLRGKTVAMPGGLGGASSYFTAKTMDAAKLSIKDVRVLSMTLSDSAVALTNKAIDAVVTSSPFTEDFAEQSLAHALSPVAPGSGAGIFFGPTLLTDSKTASSVLRAVSRGAADLVGEGYTKPETLSILSKWTKVPAEKILHGARYDYDPKLRVDSSTMMDMQRVFVGMGLIDGGGTLKPEQVIANVSLRTPR